MTISQGLVKVVFFSGEFVWWRISRTKLSTVSNRVSSQNDFRYAKIYDYERLGKRKGNVGRQLAYVYWKDGILTTRTI